MSTDARSVITVKGACPHDCPDTCALVLTVEDGVLTKVRGDADHPFTRGGLCVKVTDYQNHVYDPRCVLHPMRRTGPKGSGQFEWISWDEALDEVHDRSQSIISEHGPQAILPYSYLGAMGTLNCMSAGDPFFNRLDTTVSEKTFCDGGSITSYIMTVGALLRCLIACVGDARSMCSGQISVASSSNAAAQRRSRWRGSTPSS